MVVGEERRPFVMFGCGTRLFGINTSSFGVLDTYDYSTCIVTNPQNIFSSQVNVRTRMFHFLECWKWPAAVGSGCCSKLLRRTLLIGDMPGSPSEIYYVSDDFNDLSLSLR